MSKKIKDVVNVNNSNVATVVNEETSKVVRGKVSANVDMVSNTSLSIDEEDNESPKKIETFAKVRSLFGFMDFDRNKRGSELIASGETDFAKIAKILTKESKEVALQNEKIENISFEKICETISNSPLLSDFSLFVGGSDLLNLSSKLISSDGKIILYHGKQSEDSEKFETCKVTVNGLHKPFTDICYISYVDYSTSNVIRAFRCYSYYLASIKRCNRLKKEETDTVAQYQAIKKKLHEKFGYMPNDFENL